MRITRKLLSAIKTACRKVCGGRRKVEVGERHWPGKPDDVDGLNFLLWGADHDLADVTRLDDLAGEEILGHHGWVALDCYCYNLPVFGRYEGDELDRNVYVLISPDGRIAYASEDDMGHVAAINKILEAAGMPAFADLD